MNLHFNGISRKLKKTMDFLAYFSLGGDILIATANVVIRQLPQQSTYNYYFFSGTMTLNQQAINLFGQNIIDYIIPLTGFVFIAYIINVIIERIQERKLMAEVMDMPMVVYLKPQIQAKIKNKQQRKIRR